MNIKKTDDKLSIIQRISLFFFHHIKTTLSIWLAVLVFGFLSYTVWLQRQGFPDVAIPFGVVSAQYFVDDARTVDSDVAQVVNDAILKSDAVKSVRSTSAQNFATFAVEYKESYTSQEGNESIKSLIENTPLPDGVTFEYRAINASKFNDRYDKLLSVTSDREIPLEELMQKAETVSLSLREIDNAVISEVTVLNPFAQGVNPITGEAVTVQQSFDRYIERSPDGEVVRSESILIGIVGADGADTLHMTELLDQKLSDQKESYEALGVKVYISSDFSESINDQVNTLQQSLTEGLLIVLAVGFILISLRAGFVTAIAMVTTLFITVGALYAFGMSLNTITLFGLILCLGLIVDDATIMVEALDSARKLKKKKSEIVALVTKKVALASLAGTLTTMLGFAPLLFIGGILGDFIRALPITIITSLAVSLAVSIMLIPFLAQYFMLGVTKESRNPFHRAEDFVSNGLASLIRRTKIKRDRIIITGVALVVSLGSIIASGPLFSRLKFDIFPSAKDTNALVVNLSFEENASIEDASQVAQNVDEVIVTTLGDTLRHATYFGSGTNRDATIAIDLTPLNEREDTSPQLVQKLAVELEKVDRVDARVSQVDAGPGRDDYPFKSQIYGDEQNARALARDIELKLKDQTVSRANGSEARIVRTRVSSSNIVSRVNNKQYIEVSAGYDATDTSALVIATKDKIQQAFDGTRIESYGLSPSDVEFDFGNESDNQESFRGVIIAFPLLLGAMFILLAIQFRSLVQPLLIFSAIPFSLFGVSLGLFITDNALSFFVMVALFALIGIAVNNTILLTDYANQARRDGKGRIDAVASAVKERFRPLITTSLTSVIALVPLALSDPFWEALAYTIIFGLLSSTIMVIIAFPYYYLIFEWVRMKVSRRSALLGLGMVILTVIVSQIVGFSVLYGLIIVGSIGVIRIIMKKFVL